MLDPCREPSPCLDAPPVLTRVQTVPERSWRRRRPAHLFMQEDIFLFSSLLSSRPLSPQSPGTRGGEGQPWPGDAAGGARRCSRHGASPRGRGTNRGVPGRNLGMVDGNPPEPPLLPACHPLRHSPCQRRARWKHGMVCKHAIGRFPLAGASDQSRAGGAAGPGAALGRVLRRDGDPGSQVISASDARRQPPDARTLGFTSPPGPNGARRVLAFLSRIAQNADCCHSVSAWGFVSAQYATEMYPPRRRGLLGNHRLREIQNG